MVRKPDQFTPGDQVDKPGKKKTRKDLIAAYFQARGMSPKMHAPYKKGH